MARWEGNAPGRLEQAALDLFAEQGYDGTTVAQIARRAGLTERSFYRWFADKREVLFGGGDELQERIVEAIGRAPADRGPLEVLLSAFAVLPDVIRPRDFLRTRAEVIAASPALRERELIKTASLSEAVVAALRARGRDEPTARLATEVGFAVLHQAMVGWGADEDADLMDMVLAATKDLLAVTTDVDPAHLR